MPTDRNAPQYDTKTDAIMEGCGDFDEADFARAAIAFMDQAGMSVEAQAKVAAAMGVD